ILEVFLPGINCLQHFGRRDQHGLGGGTILVDPGFIGNNQGHWQSGLSVHTCNGSERRLVRVVRAALAAKDNTLSPKHLLNRRVVLSGNPFKARKIHLRWVSLLLPSHSHFWW